MESSVLKKASRFLREKGKHSRWRKVLTVLGAVVVFVTAYILLMPAVALEHKNVCGLEEHTHTEECYGQVLVCGKVGAGDETEEPVTLEFACTFPEELHVHTRECYDSENNLICGYADYAVHKHTESCYEDGELVCPLEEIEEHEHTDACYRINDSGYICGQEEAEAHTHTDVCYTEHRELVCGKEESEGHTHTDDCYTEEWVAVCGMEDDPEHVHDEATCYKLQRTLTCGKEESEGHQHSESCYHVEKELTCGKEENPNGHKHTEACRGVVKELICGKDEVIVHEHSVEDGCYEPVLDENGEQERDENGELLWALVCDKLEVLEHVHGDECYKEHEHTDGCYAEGLICGKEEHVHTEECGSKDEDTVFYCAGRIHAHSEECYDSEGNIICGYGDFVVHAHDEACYDSEGTLICPLPEIVEHTHTEECYNDEGSLVCELPEVSLHTHTEVCYDAEGVLTCGKLEVREHHHNDACRSPEVKEEETEEQIYTKTCEGDGYIVTVGYRADANIPEEAELIAEQITQEENEAHYAERQAQFQKTLKDEGATIRALLKIGFYLDGEEIEPESDVTVTVQLLDENGLAEGGPVTVVHFAKNETEILDGSDVKDSSTTFQMGSFSEIAIGYRTGEEESAGIYVSQVFTYEDDAVQITFQIEGNAQPLDGSEALPFGENENEEQTEEAVDVEEKETEASSEEEALEEEPRPQEQKELQKDEEEQTETPNKENTGEDDVTAETESEESKPEQKNGFEFKIDPIEKNTEDYKTFLAYAEQSGGVEELIRMKVLSYALFYEGIELDLTNCQVKAEITTASMLREQVERSIPEAVSYLRSHEEDVVQVEGMASEQVDSHEGIRQLEQQAGESTDGEEDSGEESPVETNADEAPLDGENAPAEEQKEQTEETFGNETELILTVMEQSDNVEINELANIVYEEEGEPESETIEVILNQSMFAVRASGKPNPSFTVQYYANLMILDKEATAGSTGLPVIDTTGGKLPKNGTGRYSPPDPSPNGNPIKNIYVDGSGKVLKTKTPTEVYRSRQYHYIDAPTLNYFDALIERKDNYELKEIWVSKVTVTHTDSCYRTVDEKTGERELNCKHPELESVDPQDWNVYPYSKDLHFTNRKVSGTAVPGENSGYIYIAQDAVIRLVYDAKEGSSEASANFYDYDISDGYIYGTAANANNQNNGKPTSQQNDNSKWYLHTEESGINSRDNYDNYNEKTDAKLAFGNANSGTWLGKTQKWNENELNKANTRSYQICTFGLVTGLDENGNIQYAKGVKAPKLFNDGDAVGKTVYKDYTLQFNQSGDTYTLNMVNKGDKIVARNLANFSHPGKHAIWTNHFWPMDSAESWGTDGHDPRSGATDGKEANRNFAKGEQGTSVANLPGWLPTSDDGKNHNAYFGMSYKVEFELSEDYVGPLEYCFYGDDDMWVFLDGKLVCDIGGVHTSVGEYVNLWDYISEERKAGLCSHESPGCRDEKGELICKKNKFTLNVFYTERGASGSTCWMEFTLPSASVKGLETTDEDYGRLRVDKKVAGTSNLDGKEVEWDSGDEFEFVIKLTDSDGKPLKDDYSYYKYDKDGNKVESDVIEWEEEDKDEENSTPTVWDGATFTLKNGEYIVVQYLPQGTHYTITEKNNATKFKEKKDANGNPIYNENGEPVLEADGDSDFYYFTGIVVDGKEQGENLTDKKVASGSIPQAQESKVVYTNRVFLYELPKSGGPGTNLYTMAGISLLLMAGLMYRKKFRERRAGSSRN